MKKSATASGLAVLQAEENLVIDQLSNGLRVIYRQTPRPVSHCGLIIPAGTRDEIAANGEEGAAHFIEHMLFKGTQKRRSFHVLNRLDSVGGEFNAYTTKEETWLHASFLGEYLERAMELIADIAFEATFPEQELVKERVVILDELHAYLDQPGDAIFDDFEALMFRGHPMAGNILGTKESVSAMTRDRLKGFVDRMYAPSSMVFSVVSDRPWKEVKRLLDKHLAGRSGMSGRLPERHKASTLPSFDERMSKDLHQAHHLMGTLVPGSDHPDRLGLSLLANYLGGPTMNNRLSLSVRERHGLAYYVECSYTPYTDIGLFSVYFGTDEQAMDKAERLVMKELRLAREQKLGTRALHDLKRQVTGHIALSQDSGGSLMSGLGKSLLLYDRVESLGSLFDAIEAVTAEDLLRLANEHLQPDSISHLVYT
jgi:predicted Zn-dependent peptidase